MPNNNWELLIDYEVKEWKSLSQQELKLISDLNNTLENNDYKSEFQWSDKDYLTDLWFLGKNGNILEWWKLNIPKTNSELWKNIYSKVKYIWIVNEKIDNKLQLSWATNTYPMKQEEILTYVNNLNNITNVSINWNKIIIKYRTIWWYIWEPIIINKTTSLWTLKQTLKNKWLKSFKNWKTTMIIWNKIFPSPTWPSFESTDWASNKIQFADKYINPNILDLSGEWFFKLDSSKLTDIIKNKLDKQITTIIQLIKNWYKINIIWYASTEWNDIHNKKLSQARAEAIKQYLINKWIPEEKIIAIWYWETEQFGNKLEDNRKIEITAIKENLIAET